jgi:class 3 adenylate cyclase/tetratricopeptide (TPR) repeat protein
MTGRTTVQPVAARQDTLRRPTVLVCDLAASTAIAEQIGEEPLWELLLEYQDACSEVIHRFDGTVYKRLGDGLLALFGIPHAHEDDPVRAVHAALALVGTVAQLSEEVKESLGIELALRVGVHTGDVVVGEIAGELEVAGKAVHQADRLQSLAEPNGVVISDDTAELVGDEFELRPRGEVDLRGLSTATVTYDVMKARETATLSRTEPMAMVGRAEERAAVGAAWREVLGGGSQVMLIVGEAGLGKSRLARFARDHAAREGGVPLQGECSPYHADIPFHVIGRMLAGHLTLDPGASRTKCLEELAAGLAAAGVDPRRGVPLLAPLLSIDPGGEFDEVELSPGDVAKETTDVILEWWFGLAANEARAIVIDDLHNADPSTLQLVNRAVKEGLAPGVFLILTTSPGLDVPAVDPEHVIELTPLPGDDARELLEALSPAMPDVSDELIERSGGNPLFLRELARAHSESGRVVPGGLRDLLMARLDAAGDLELAQIASVIGRTIDPRLLETVAGSGDITERVENLVDHGILRHHRDEKGRGLRFAQQMLGETAYASVPTRRRQSVHSKLADIYQAGEGGLESASLAALHLDRAARFQEAVEAYLVAADAASSRGAFSEALRHLDRARQLADDELPEETGQELKRVAVTRTSFVLIAREGFGSEAASEAASKALALASPDSVIHSAGPRLAAFSQATILGQRPEAGEIIAGLEADLSSAPEADRIQIEAEIVFARALHDFGLGRFSPSRDNFEKALELFHGSPRHGAPWPEYPLPTSLPATAHGQLIPIYWIQGDRSLSKTAARRARQAAAELPPPMDAFNLAYAVGYVGWVHLMDGEVAKAREAQREQGDIGREHGFAMWESLADAFEAVTAAQLEPSIELADEVAEKRQHAAMSAGSSFQPFLLASEGQIRLRAGQIERAIELFDESLELADATSEFIYLPETHRLRARAHTNTDLIRADLDRAWELAMSQDAPIFALRAVIDMGNLLETPPEDLAERINRVLGEMGEPETYREHALARDLLASSR